MSRIGELIKENIKKLDIFNSKTGLFAERADENIPEGKLAAQVAGATGMSIEEVDKAFKEAEGRIENLEKPSITQKPSNKIRRGRENTNNQIVIENNKRDDERTL